VLPASASALNAAPADPADQADPTAALTRAFDTIRRTRMAGIPILNDAVGVEAVGFHRWQGFWLGVLVTPWCMNLVLMEADAVHWPRLRSGEKFSLTFPAGRFEFIFGREALLGASTGDDTRGETLMCSLFSPMFDFADHAGARATALACLSALFDANNAEAADISLGAVPVTLQQDAAQTAARLEREAAQEPTLAIDASKRNFLRGRWHPSSDTVLDTKPVAP
jgi:[NiFe] hydrogenase assembly HybE family chaperone